MEFNIISFIFIYSPADSRKPWLPYRLVCQSGEGLRRGDTGRDRDRDRGKERNQQGGGQSESEEALGTEVSAILGRQRRPRVDGERRWRQRRLVSAGTRAGMGLKAGQMEGWRYKRKARGGHQEQVPKEAGGWSVGWGEEVTSDDSNPADERNFQKKRARGGARKMGNHCIASSPQGELNTIILTTVWLQEETERQEEPVRAREEVRK